jgi:hypothetical protein
MRDSAFSASFCFYSFWKSGKGGTGIGGAKFFVAALSTAALGGDQEHGPEFVLDALLGAFLLPSRAFLHLHENIQKLIMKGC